MLWTLDYFDIIKKSDIMEWNIYIINKGLGETREKWAN